MAERHAHSRTVEIDEAWLATWIEFGFAELGRFLTNHALFAAYLATHPTKEEQ